MDPSAVILSLPLIDVFYPSLACSPISHIYWCNISLRRAKEWEYGPQLLCNQAISLNVFVEMCRAHTKVVTAKHNCCIIQEHSLIMNGFGDFWIHNNNLICKYSDSLETSWWHCNDYCDNGLIARIKTNLRKWDFIRLSLPYNFLFKTHIHTAYPRSYT